MKNYLFFKLLLLCCILLNSACKKEDINYHTINVVKNYTHLRFRLSGTYFDYYDYSPGTGSGGEFHDTSYFLPDAGFIDIYNDSTIVTIHTIYNDSSINLKYPFKFQNIKVYDITEFFFSRIVRSAAFKTDSFEYKIDYRHGNSSGKFLEYHYKYALTITK